MTEKTCHDADLSPFDNGTFRFHVKVNCKKDAENRKETVAYGLFVTFEVAEGLDVDVYTSVVNKIRQAVPITTLGRA